MRPPFVALVRLWEPEPSLFWICSPPTMSLSFDAAIRIRRTRAFLPCIIHRRELQFSTVMVRLAGDRYSRTLDSTVCLKFFEPRASTSTANADRSVWLQTVLYWTPAYKLSIKPERE